MEIREIRVTSTGTDLASALLSGIQDTVPGTETPQHHL